MKSDKKISKSVGTAIAAFALAAACALPSHAAVISTSGTLPDSPAGAYTLFNFNVITPGITTLLLAGNTDAFLGLFSGTNVMDNGTYIAQNDDSGGNLNSFLSLNLWGRQLHCVDHELWQLLEHQRKCHSFQPRPDADELHLDDQR